MHVSEYHRKFLFSFLELVALNRVSPLPPNLFFVSPDPPPFPRLCSMTGHSACMASNMFGRYSHASPVFILTPAPCDHPCGEPQIRAGSRRSVRVALCSRQFGYALEGVLSVRVWGCGAGMWGDGARQGPLRGGVRSWGHIAACTVGLRWLHRCGQPGRRTRVAQASVLGASPLETCGTESGCLEGTDYAVLLQPAQTPSK